jgi:AdoMet-dependent heme synthase
MRFKVSTLFHKLPNIPSEIMLEVTNRCNLNCEFCFNKIYIPQERKNETLSTSDIKYIIDKIKKSKVQIVRFTGGEPLLRDDIFELMDYAHQKGLRVWLNTNATLITRPIAQKIAKYAENVLIPLNADNCESEKAITGKNTFKSKLKGILLLKKNRIKCLRCGTVATKANIANLEKIYDLVKRLPISDWELFRVIPLSEKDVSMNNDDIALLVEKMLKINKQANKNYNIANAIPFCAYDPEKVKKVSLGGFADDGHTRFVIDTVGNAKPMYYMKECIGNIFYDDIIGIWNCKFMKDMRLLNHVPNVCRTCRYIKKCKGGSRIAAKIIKGNYKEADYLAQPYKYKYF